MPKTFTDAQWADILARMGAQPIPAKPPTPTPPTNKPPGLLSRVSGYDGKQRLARDVRNRDGVCVDNRLQRSDVTAAQLDMLHMRNIRMQMMMNQQDRSPWLLGLQDAMHYRGMVDPNPRALGLVMAYMNDLGTTADMQVPGFITAAKAGLLLGIELPNEINNDETGGGSHGVNDRTKRTGNDAWPALGLEWATWGAAVRAAHPELFRVLLLAPSIMQTDFPNYALAKDLSKLCDSGNMHQYAGGGNSPSIVAGLNMDVGNFNTVRLRNFTPQGFINRDTNFQTEGGAATDGRNYDGGGRSQAKYYANALFEAWATETRFYGYQLEDGNTGDGAWESNLGLFQTTGPDGVLRPKPVVNLIAKMKDAASLNRSYGDPANLVDDRPFTPALDVSKVRVSGIDFPNSLPQSWLALHLSDRTTAIVIANGGQRTDSGGWSIEAAHNTATINFGVTQRRISLVDLLDDGTTVANAPVLGSNTAEVNVDLTGFPKILLLDAP